MGFTENVRKQKWAKSGYQRKGNLIMTKNGLGLENVTEIKIIIICMRKLSSLSITAEIVTKLLTLFLSSLVWLL